MVGEVIKKYREEHDLSQRDFAKRTKLSPSYINTLEKLYNPKNSKPYSITIDVADQLAKAMNITLEEFLNKCDYKIFGDNIERCSICKYREEKQDLFLLDNKYYCEYCLIEALATKGIIGLEQTDEGREVLY